MPTIAALQLNNDMNFALWFEINLKNMGLKDIVGNIVKRKPIRKIEFITININTVTHP